MLQKVNKNPFWLWPLERKGRYTFGVLRICIVQRCSLRNQIWSRQNIYSAWPWIKVLTPTLGEEEYSSKVTLCSIVVNSDASQSEDDGKIFSGFWFLDCLYFSRWNFKLKFCVLLLYTMHVKRTRCRASAGSNFNSANCVQDIKNAHFVDNSE